MAHKPSRMILHQVWLVCWRDRCVVRPRRYGVSSAVSLLALPPASHTCDGRAREALELISSWAAPTDLARAGPGSGLLMTHKPSCVMLHQGLAQQTHEIRHRLRSGERLHQLSHVHVRGREGAHPDGPAAFTAVGMAASPTLSGRRTRGEPGCSARTTLKRMAEQADTRLDVLAPSQRSGLPGV